MWFKINQKTVNLNKLYSSLVCNFILINREITNAIRFHVKLKIYLTQLQFPNNLPTRVSKMKMTIHIGKLNLIAS